MMTKLLPAVLLPVWLTSCATSTITNLTPSSLPRSANGQYMVEMQLDHRVQALKDSSIEPYVVVGFEKYKMGRTPRMTSRWEAYVPVPAGQNSIIYHFKAEFKEQKFGKVSEGSRLSPEYKLSVADKQP